MGEHRPHAAQAPPQGPADGRQAAVVRTVRAVDASVGRPGPAGVEESGWTRVRVVARPGRATPDEQSIAGPGDGRLTRRPVRAAAPAAATLRSARGGPIPAQIRPTPRRRPTARCTARSRAGGFGSSRQPGAAMSSMPPCGTSRPQPSTSPPSDVPSEAFTIRPAAGIHGPQPLSDRRRRQRGPGAGSQVEVRRLDQRRLGTAVVRRGRWRTGRGRREGATADRSNDGPSGSSGNGFQVPLARSNRWSVTTRSSSLPRNGHDVVTERDQARIRIRSGRRGAVAPRCRPRCRTRGSQALARREPARAGTARRRRPRRARLRCGSGPGRSGARRSQRGSYAAPSARAASGGIAQSALGGHGSSSRPPMTSTSVPVQKALAA